MMGEYEYQKDIDISALDEAIRVSSFAAKYDGVVTDGTGDVFVRTIEVLSAAEQDELDAIIAGHDKDVPAVASTIEAQAAFGLEVIGRYHRKFAALGLFSDPDNYAVATSLARYAGLARLGNLVAVDADLAATPPTATYLDAATITAIRNEIRGGISNG